MSECGRLSDRMIEVLHLRSNWAAGEVTHLAGCPDCRAEWRVLEAARGLGAAVANRVDPERLGPRVLAGVAAARRRARWLRAGWLGGLAAAAAVTLLLWSPWGNRTRRTTPERELLVPLAELEGLTTQQLEGLLDQFAAPLGSAAASDAPGLGDLGDEELEQVLNTLEG